METYTLTSTCKKVWDFYQKHPNLDFEAMNLLFVNIMENLSHDITSSLSNSVATQILSNIKELQSQIISVNDSVGKIHNDTQMCFQSKFTEFKKEYLEDVKLLLNSNNSDKIAPLIKEYNSGLFDKTFIMINEVIPKNNDSLTKQIQENIKSFYSSIAEDTNKLLNSNINQKSLDDFIQNIDNKFMNSQQLINTLINTTEQRLENKMNAIQDISSSNQYTQSSLNKTISELLKKMEIASVKGKCSENILFNILQSLYSTAQIEVVGEQKETGDFMLTRKNKPTILIENKNWNKNVIQDEVKKFIRDVETQNCCGLFLSQNFGIANKENFEININNGNILLYVHEVNNDAEKIRIAIDIIDNFKLKLDEIVVCNGDGYNIDKEILDEINKEYQLFATQKILQIKMVKDFSAKMVKQLEDLQFPCLENFLSTKYAFSSSKYICEFCEYVAKNQSAMSAHKRGCKGKHAISCENETNTNVTTELKKQDKSVSIIQEKSHLVPQVTQSKKSEDLNLNLDDIENVKIDTKKQDKAQNVAQIPQPKRAKQVR